MWSKLPIIVDAETSLPQGDYKLRPGRAPEEHEQRITVTGVLNHQSATEKPVLGAEPTYILPREAIATHGDQQEHAELKTLLINGERGEGPRGSKCEPEVTADPRAAPLDEWCHSFGRKLLLDASKLGDRQSSFAGACGQVAGWGSMTQGIKYGRLP